MVARICSADLTQTNGRLLSFQASMRPYFVWGSTPHVQPARFLRVSARMPPVCADKAWLSEPISLRSPQ